MEERIILHSDCNSFFASVEEVMKPELKKYPMAVCGSIENRHGIILAKNQLAKKFNILTAETVIEAKRKCPDLVLVEPHHNKYSEYSKIINQIYQSFTDLVEPFGVDESWLDVSGSSLLFGSGYDIAHQLRRYIRENLGLTVSVGVSYNKVFAKLGSDYKKPDAVTEINHDNYKNIVHPLPVTDLFMVGRNVADSLRSIGINTIGDLAQTPQSFMSSRFGKIGENIHAYANGIDGSPVVSFYNADVPKSVGNGMTFRRDLVTREDISTGVLALTDEVTSRLRKYGLKCNTLQVSLKNSDFKTVSKQATLPYALNSKKDIYDASMSVIDLFWKKGSPVRSITVTCTNLSVMNYRAEQMDMFGNLYQNDRIRRNERIDAAVDTMRIKYGRHSLFSASLLNNDIGV